MSAELQAAIARLEYVSRDEEVPDGLAAGAKLSEDVAAVLAALSSPPADDVREALIERHGAAVEVRLLQVVARRLNFQAPLLHADDTGAWMDLARAVVREARS